MDLKNQIQDFLFVEKNALLNLHWTMDQFGKADFFKLQEVLNAKGKEDHLVDPLTLG